MTVHLPLASHAGVFRRARPTSLVGRDERRAPLKTPPWEANLPRDSVKFNFALYSKTLYEQHGVPT